MFLFFALSNGFVTFWWLSLLRLFCLEFYETRVIAIYQIYSVYYNIIDD